MTELTQEDFKQPRLWLSALLCSLLLAVEVYVLLYDLKPKNRIEDNARPVIATFDKGINEVRNKPSGTISWYQPPDGELLKRLDTILTMEDSQALLTFIDHAVMSVDPDSLVVLEKTPSENSDNYQKIIIRILRGSITRKSGGSLPLDVEVSHNGKITKIEDPKGDSQFRVLKTETGEIKLEVSKGGVKFSDARGIIQTVASRQVASINGEVMKVSPLVIGIDRMSPDKEKLIVRDSVSEGIILTWDQINYSGRNEKDNIEVHISQGPDFDDSTVVNLNGSISGRNTMKFIPKKDGLYYWKVLGGEGEVTSETAKFNVLTKSIPVVVSPQDNAEVLADERMVFEFEKNVGSTVVEISRFEDFHRLLMTLPTSIHPSGVNLKSLGIRFDKPEMLYWRLRTDYGSEAGFSKPSEVRRIEVKIKPKPKLRAPKIKKHDIKIEEDEEAMIERELDVVSAVSKSTNDKSSEVTLAFEWDDVEKAVHYQVQVATDAEFRNVVRDEKIPESKYEFTTEKALVDRKFYYRIAGIEADGEVGEFTDGIEVFIEAMPPAFSADDLKNKGRFRITLTAGAAYDSRKFMSKTLPKSATGSGVIPMFIGGELHKEISKKHNIAIGASALLEKAEPKTANVVRETYPIPLIRLWGMNENERRGYAYGLYSSTSQHFSWNGRQAKNERKILVGATGMLFDSALIPRLWHWRSQLSLIVVGALGADLSVMVRPPLFSWKPTRVVEYRGAICEIEILKRYVTIEDSYGGIVRLGYAF